MKNKPIFWGVLFAFISWLSWPSLPFPFLIGIAWAALFQMHVLLEQQNASRWKIWGTTYVSMWLWNFLCTWWIWNADEVGAIIAIFANSALMTLPLMAFVIVKKRTSNLIAYLTLISTWLSFEWLHFNWSLSWPWLTLGHVFAKATFAVQWYEYTGVLGGSIWVITMGILLFEWYQNKLRKQLIQLGLVVVVPIVISLVVGFLSNVMLESKESALITVIQPNIDPYEKFDDSQTMGHRALMRDLSLQNSAENTDLFVFPETAVTGDIDEKDVHSNNRVIDMRSILQNRKNAALLYGIESYAKFGEKRQRTTHFSEGFGFYEVYNSALFDNGNKPVVYHKSKFVPGAETIPFPSLLGPLVEALQFSQVGDFTPQDEAVVFENKKVKVAPIICYESVFGAYVGNYVQKGANVLCIITNDAWWGNTPGHQQHFDYARLRAIEHRRCVVRSANTGISGFIDAQGNVIEKLGWDKEGAIQETIPLYHQTTLYTRFGDWLGYVAVAMCCFVIGYVGFNSFKK